MLYFGMILHPLIYPIFAYCLGFYTSYCMCRVVSSPDAASDNLQKASMPFAMIVILAIVLRDLFFTAFENHLTLISLGCLSGFIMALYVEGSFHWLWRRLHPQSAPTEHIKAGQRGFMPSFVSKHSSALMGTSTAFFAVDGLDVKTTAVIKLCIYAFKIDRFTTAALENALRLGDGRRYKAFQKLIVDSQFEKHLADIIHPYKRAINGNHSSARAMFTQLCQLARQTRNTSDYTMNRLLEIGRALGLTQKDMARALGH